MKPIQNWKEVLLGAWSVRLMVLAAILSSLPIFIAYVNADILGVSPLTFAILAAGANVLGILSRIVQQTLSTRNFMTDESGAVSRRGVGFAAAAAIVGAAVLATPMISKWEGRELVAYRDIVGVWTICDGETLGVKPGDVATNKECDRKLQARVHQFATEIAKCLPPDLPVEMRAAFTSTAYNIGSGAFCRSSMSRRALAGNLRGACDAVLMWNKGRINGKLTYIQGLANRRKDERALCLKGLRGDPA